MTTARILEAKQGSILTFREDLVGNEYYSRSPAPELSPFEGQFFQVTQISTEGIIGQVLAADGKKVLFTDLRVGLDEDIFKLNQ